MSTIKTYSSTLNSTASLELGLKALAKYLYQEGAIKVETKWDPELNTDRTCYKIDVLIEPEK
ncbi:MAG: hypothetical protein UF228_01025 [Lachnospiraceae bacterium]|nr:hypothetical protein [Lachnospiraceae bacterium]